MSTRPRQKISTTTPALASRLLVYLRQSVGESMNQQGIPGQRSICERFAVENGLPWDARTEFVDVGYSRDDLDRPEYRRLLADAREGDVILVWERSRLGIDLDFAVAVRDLVQRRRARILVASGDAINASHDGLILEHMRGKSDGDELRRIRTRVREKLRARVLAGYVAGPLPYGLRSVLVDENDPDGYKRGVVVPEEAAVIVRIATTYLDDSAGYDRICHSLNREGIASPGGGEWSRAHIWDILTNPTYRGVYVYGKRGGKGGRFDPITVAHPEWVIGTPELWAAVDAARVERTRDMPAKLNAAKHALSGVGKCAACGGPLSVQIDGRPGKKVTDYQCSRRRRGKRCDARFRIRAAVLEGAIRDELGPWLDAAELAISEAAREVEARIAGRAAPDVAALERELQAARAEQQRLVKLAVATGGEVEAVADALREGQANVKRLEAAIVRARAPQADAGALARQVEAAALGRLAALREALHGPDAREALRALFPQGISLRAAPDAFEVSADGVLPSVRESDEVRTDGRIPFRLTIPRAA